MCDKYGLSYENVYTWSNETYNDGYSKLSKTNVIRPVLLPPKGKSGGHCIGNNYKLLPLSLLSIISRFLDNIKVKKKEGTFAEEKR